MTICIRLRAGSSFRWSIIFIIIFTIVYLSVTQLSKASVYGVVNIFTVEFDDGSVENFNENSNDHLLLENISKKEYELINTKLKIFFVQTSENDDIISRHACSIESAARLHPNGLIFVLMRSKYIHLKKGSYIHLRSYNNIYFVHFNEQDIYSGTSLIRLNKTKRKQYIHYFKISHMSDFIRTALLYKYGGIYFDLDVIPLKSFQQFSNTVGLETNHGVNVAVLIFEKQHLVLDLQMDKQLESIENQFHALCWSCLGPSALTDALKNVCDQHQLYIHDKDKCHQIDILPSFVFYPMSYQQIPQLFRRSKENVNFLLKNSSIYSIHYFHHMTMNLPIEIMSPFAQIAEIYCPNVYKELIDQNLSNQSSKYFFTNINIFLLCLFITFLCIFIFILISHFLSYIRLIRMKLFTIQHKFHKLLF
ncbi:unnamed protein product [Rotaria sordida]|uniref:Alpha 1,4-glycosyltransferase domain-containing protein n=1 Tax=Rotaria sordida TaxID=392033 RepID=A0A813Z0J6_9BILA|nr:unnamed protein product [Rotaria sordida]